MSAEPTVHRVSTRGREALRVLDWDHGGAPVVMLHPNGFCGGLYEPVARALTGDARTIAIDLAGHGDSTTPTDPTRYRFASMARDVLDVLDQLGLRGIAGVGASLGGAVAVLVDQLDPGRWSQLLLAEPVAFPPSLIRPDRPNPMATAARRRRRSFGTRSEMRTHYRSREPLSQLGADALDGYLQWGTIEHADGVHLACDPDTEALVFEMSTSAHGAPAAWDHLAHLSCPAVIVAGADSFLPDVFDRQADRADATLLTLAGGHFVLHEDTNRTEALIRTRVLQPASPAQATGEPP
ncbi:MAG: alpha/beta hydrolase [Microthrixaceae bacterium]|nr:alpha/beta hydrolase [Microthrixaceae bacterium]